MGGGRANDRSIGACRYGGRDVVHPDEPFYVMVRESRAEEGRDGEYPLYTR